MSKSNMYLFANWKMYLNLAESEKLAKELVRISKKNSNKIKMAVFPSALAFNSVAKILNKKLVAIGSQNIHAEDRGGFTGEVSGQMFKMAGAEYTLIGHSERRHLFHETNHDTKMKMEAALSNKLVPVLCVGETLKEREEGKTKEVIDIQLRSALDGLNWPKSKKLIIAYEPVWAISKGIGADEAGKHCDFIEAEKMHILIRKLLASLVKDVKIVILFGGSVRPNTVREYLQQQNIDGVLVGAASTKLDSWLAIMHNAC